MSHLGDALKTASYWVAIGIALSCTSVHAQNSGATLESPSLLATSEAPSFHAYPGVLLAQMDIDDSYDPFADYSEFEESMEEEEDINFFRNGRLFTMGFIGGYRGFTQNLGQVYYSSPSFGLFLSYFFDLRFALQFGVLMSDHTLFVAERPGVHQSVQGNVSLTDISFLLKYYFNTQNVTRGLASLNPFVVAGFSQVYRTTTFNDIDVFAKDSAFAFNVGAGIEIPMMRNKMYWGVQGHYQLINFPDEAKVIHDVDEASTGITLSGDSYVVLGILGVNF